MPEAAGHGLPSFHGATCVWGRPVHERGHAGNRRRNKALFRRTTTFVSSGVGGSRQGIIGFRMK